MCACVFQRPNTTLWVSSGQPLRLIVCLTEDGLAQGDVFWDDGETLNTYETDQYAYIVFKMKQVLEITISLTCIMYTLCYRLILK